jgi:hypothetical protein
MFGSCNHRPQAGAFDPPSGCRASLILAAALSSTPVKGLRHQYRRRTPAAEPSLVQNRHGASRERSPTHIWLIANLPA